MLDPSADDPEDTATVLDFWERAALAYRGDAAPGRPGTPAPRRPTRQTPWTCCSPRSRRSPDDEHRASGQAVQRHARQPPVPALLRHPRRLRRHGPVPGAGPPRPRRCSCATSTGWRRVTSRGPRWPRTCRTTTSPRRSCSRACRARSPTSAPPTTRPRTTSTTSSASGSTPPTACRPARSGSCPPTSTTTSWPRCAARRASTTATSRP